jgi:hypothetical protein
MSTLFGCGYAPLRKAKVKRSLSKAYGTRPGKNNRESINCLICAFLGKRLTNITQLFLSSIGSPSVTFVTERHKKRHFFIK